MTKRQAYWIPRVMLAFTAFLLIAGTVITAKLILGGWYVHAAIAAVVWVGNAAFVKLWHQELHYHEDFPS